MRETVVIKIRHGEDDNYNSREALYIDGEYVMYAGPLWECPEDATLERDLHGPSSFVDLLKQIIDEHNGKQIKFEYEEVNLDEEDL